MPRLYDSRKRIVVTGGAGRRRQQKTLVPGADAGDCPWCRDGSSQLFGWRRQARAARAAIRN